MDITINGEIHQIPMGVSTLSDLFEYLDLKSQGRIVELNGTLYMPPNFSTVHLSELDVVEIIQFMGGGAF